MAGNITVIFHLSFSLTKQEGMIMVTAPDIFKKKRDDHLQRNFEFFIAVNVN